MCARGGEPGIEAMQFKYSNTVLIIQVNEKFFKTKWGYRDGVK